MPVCLPVVAIAPGQHDPVVHWSRWRALVILIVATLLMSACADLTTEHIKPILEYSSVSQVSLLYSQCVAGKPAQLPVCHKEAILLGRKVMPQG